MSAIALRRRRRRDRRLPDPRGHPTELRRRADAVGHLALVRGGATSGQVWECDPTQRRQRRGPPGARAFGTTRRWPSTPTTSSSTSPRTTPTGASTASPPRPIPTSSTGTLEAADVAADGAVTWVEVPDPSAAEQPTRQQVPETTAFNGGEGIWFHEGSVFFTTKGDNHVWSLRHRGRDASRSLYDGSGRRCKGVDNITVEAGTGDLYVAEDGDDMELVRITPDGEATPFLRIVDEGTPADGLASEITGPAFSPDGTRLLLQLPARRPGQPGHQLRGHRPLPRRRRHDDDHQRPPAARPRPRRRAAAGRRRRLRPRPAARGRGHGPRPGRHGGRRLAGPDAAATTTGRPRRSAGRRADSLRGVTPPPFRPGRRPRAELRRPAPPAGPRTARCRSTPTARRPCRSPTAPPSSPSATPTAW